MKQPLSGKPRAEALNLLAQADNEAGAKKLLSFYGLQPVREEVCAGVKDLPAAAKRLGYPVALKILSPDILHKSEAGGVALNLADEAALLGAAETMLATVRERQPKARLAGFVLQEMIGAPVAEVILGVQVDPHAGPAVLCGLGGIYAEILDDVAVGLAPLTEEEAMALLRRLRSFAILDGARGRPKGDVAALAKAMADLSVAAHELRGHVASIDVNPLAVLPEGRGVRVVDAVIQRGS